MSLVSLVIQDISELNNYEGFLSLDLCSRLIGILIPWLAKHLDNSVLSITPGNFFAEYDRKGSENILVIMGAEGDKELVL